MEEIKLEILSSIGDNMVLWCPTCKKDAAGKPMKCIAALDNWSKKYSDKHTHKLEKD